jgi:lipopolysaccharide export system protein LptA
MTVLLCVLCASLLWGAMPVQQKKAKARKNTRVQTAKREKTDPKRIYLIHADELRFDRWQNNDAQILRGNVEFEHDGARLLCDSANFFEQSNSFEAFGHVQMYQGDTLSLKSDYGYYDGNDQMMQALQNVVLKNRKTTLYTDSLFYDRIWSMGYFQEGGKLVDGTTTLTSDWGEYHADTKMAVFYYDVQMRDKNFYLTTDSLYYDTRGKLAHIVGPTDITSGKSHVYSELGYYNTQTEQSQLLNRSVLDNEGRRLIGDSLWHDSQKEVSEAFRNVVYTDSVNKNMLTSNYGYYDQATGYAMTTDSAVVIDYSQRDTLFMHADTFKIYTYNNKTDSVYRVMHAYNKVRAYRTDVQAVCDSLVYNSLDSCMTMYRDPIVWNVNQQLVGEEIQVFMKDSVIDRAHVINQAFSIEKLPEDGFYNQISSKEMYAYFQNGEMNEARAVDNVIVDYFPEDQADSSYVGMVYMETSELRMFMEQRKLQRIWAPKSTGNMYPITQIPPSKRYLQGFNWFDYVRPLSKEDIFVWRPKKEGTTLKPVKRREAPKMKL